MEENKFGYVVSDRKLDDLREYVGLVKDVSSADPTSPILIVGLKKAKEYAGDKFSILNKRISENVFWTFSRVERRQDYEKDILLFYKFIINNIINNINYYYINFYKLKYNRFKILYNILFNKNINKFIYLKHDMVYLYYDNNHVLGFSLKMLSYIGISKKKIYLKIKNAPNTVINFDSSEIPMMFKTDIKNSDYVIPYLMSKSLKNVNK